MEIACSKISFLFEPNESVNETTQFRFDEQS